MTIRFLRNFLQPFSKIDAGLLTAALLTLFIIQSLLRPGLPTAADLTIHLYRTMEYANSWAPGVIVPGWAPNLAYGYGYPLFIFAPPLPYFLGWTLQALGLSFAGALKTLIILTIPLYAIGMYLLVRDLLHSVEAGLVAATAYAFAPFALREALLVGGNVPQFLAIALFPWTLWTMTRAARTHGWGWAALSAIFFAGVVLSHLFQVLIITPVVGVFGLLLFFYTRAGIPVLAESPPSILPTVAKGGEVGWFNLLPRTPAPYLPLLTIPLGLLLSAFFWLPALIERFYTRAQADIYLEKSPFFVRYPHWTELLAWIQPLDLRAANPYVPLTLGVVTLVLAGLGLVAVGWQLIAGVRRSRRAGGKQSIPLFLCSPAPPLTLFFALVAASGIFMTLSASRWVWETVSILQVSEFPWRMLGLANLGLAFLAGAAGLLVPKKIRPLLTAGCLLVQIWAVAPFLYPVTGFTRYDDLTLADQIDYERRSQSIGTTTLGEYLPRRVTQPPTTSPLVAAFQAGQKPERLDRDSLPAGATATAIEQTAVTHRYHLDAPAAFTLRIFQFDFPGWQARLDGQAVPLRPETETGLILINIPAGRHTLTLHFGETPVRLAAISLSGLAVISLIVAGTVQYRRSAVGGQRSVITAPYLPLKSGLIIGLCLLITVAALWLKPLLRPIFTLKSPPDQALPAQHQTQVEFANGIQLIGYDLSRTVVPSGGYLQVVLYWQTKAGPYQVNLQPFVHLDRLDDFTTIADATNYTPGDVTTESNMPTFHWDNTRYIRDEHDLTIPPATPPLAYAVRAGLIDAHRRQLIPLADGTGDTVQLTTINVAAGSPPAPLTNPLDILFDHGGEMIRLTGFEPVSQTPERLEFKLSWQIDQPLQTDLTIFAQLLDLNQNLVASFDRPPLGGAYPTSTWLSGQNVIDPRHIPLDQVPPGEYRLIVGLYDPVTQQRLTTASGADFVELLKIVINQP